MAIRTTSQLPPSGISRRRFIGCGCTAAAALILGPGFLAACSSDNESGSASSSTPQSRPSVTPAATLFTNVNVFNGKSLAVAKGMSVLVKDGTIAAVQPGTIAAPDGAMTIDGGGRTLMPGLIDTAISAHPPTNLAASAASCRSVSFSVPASSPTAGTKC